jgi:hypothetical protein
LNAALAGKRRYRCREGNFSQRRGVNQQGKARCRKVSRPGRLIRDARAGSEKATHPTPTRNIPKCFANRFDDAATPHRLFVSGNPFCAFRVAFAPSLLPPEAPASVRGLQACSFAAVQVSRWRAQTCGPRACALMPPTGNLPNLSSAILVVALSWRAVKPSADSKHCFGARDQDASLMRCSQTAVGTALNLCR